MSRCSRLLISGSASNALSPIKAPGSTFSRSGSAQERSWSCPGASMSSTGLPKASARAAIFVLNPPRDRPIACAPFFFEHPRYVDEQYDGCIDHHVFVVVIAGQHLEDALEN